MNTAAITPLRQNALSMLEMLPEDQLPAAISYMRIKSKARSLSEEDVRERRAAFERLERMVRLTPVRAENSEAFKELMKLRRPVSDLDEKKELEYWRMKKYGDARAD
ncbi:MAG: hypothetical protein J6T92_05975 [Ottowia sp.]|nr:hypothetical protein [Ottowia sp.]